MSSLNIFFQIADCTIEIQELKREQSPKRLLPFYVDNKKADFTYHFLYVDKINPTASEQIIYTDEKSIVVTTDKSSNNYFSIYRTNADGIISAVLKKKSENIMSVEILDSIFAETLHEYFILDLLHFEIPLLKHHAFVLHSSFIEINGKAILFTAPSGGGKSTQANLWVENRKARIINGDKNIVAFVNGQWMAYGLPMSGSSPHYLNEGWPLESIIVLKKYSKNQITELGESAFFPIMQQIISEPWNEEFDSELVELVCNLCNDVSIYQYYCTKTSKAVDVLEEALFEKTKE